MEGVCDAKASYSYAFDRGGMFTGHVTGVKPASTVAMFRLYNPNSGEHFYTGNAAEKNHLAAIGWKSTGVGWTAPVKSGAPVYRVYNPNAGDHHYTMNPAERDNLVRLGWRSEGVGWYSAGNSGRAPLYREYNPNARSGAHNYTLNKAENDMLVRVGWRYEGVACGTRPVPDQRRMMSLWLVYEGVAFCVLPWRCRRGPCWLVSYSCSCDAAVNVRAALGSVDASSSAASVHAASVAARGGPVGRVLPLRQAFPVRLGVPAAWAAWVKSVPPRARSGCFARLAACMSRSFPCLVPSNSYTMLRFLPNPWCCDVH